MCDCYDCLENIRDLPIELRRIDDVDVELDRKLTSSTMSSFNDVSIKSKSVSNLRLNDTECRSVSKQSSVDEEGKSQTEDVSVSSTNSLKKPKLVKQKKSICDDDMDELLDEPKDMNSSSNSPPEYKVLHDKYHQKGKVSLPHCGFSFNSRNDENQFGLIYAFNYFRRFDCVYPKCTALLSMHFL